MGARKRGASLPPPWPSPREKPRKGGDNAPSPPATRMKLRLTPWLALLAATLSLSGCDKINEFIGNKDAKKTAAADKKGD